MSRPGRRSRRGFAQAGFSCFFVLLCCVAHVAHADRTFSTRYSTNDTGDISLIGNTLMTCPAAASGCATAQTGGTANNNDFSMTYIDSDSDTNTFNSSSATLNLPAGASVLWAGLYWGGVSNSAARGQALLRRAGAFGYSPVNAQILDNNSTTTSVYQAFADVTAAVQFGGSGSYTVANVQSTNNAANVWAGWSLIVVYRDTNQALRNLTVFDGFAVDPVTVTVAGFLTPLSGPIVSRMGVVTYDPDNGFVGDVFQLNGTDLTNAANGTGNVYNATISDLGVHVSTKTPDYRNQLGFEIDRFGVPPGVMANGANSATITVSAPNETVYPGVITFVTDLYLPVVVPNLTKTVADVNGGLLLAGDTLRYTITFSNTGQDTAINALVTDNIPVGTTYAPNSLAVVSGANTGAKTDASGDDQAEYIASGTPRTVYRVGTGANATQGGAIPFNQSTSMRFDVTVNSGLAGGTDITNSVSIQYTGQTLGETLGTSRSQATPTVVAAPPTITKSFSPNPIAAGGISSLSIQIASSSSNPATLTGVTFTDTYPSGLVNAASPNPQIICTPGSTAGTITGGTAGGNTIGLNPGANLAPGGSCTITVNVTAAATNNYVNTTSAVASTNAGSGAAASATLSVGRPSIAKSFVPTSMLAGGTSTITFVVSNPTTTNISGVAFSDTLTNMVVASPNGVVGNCGGGTVTATPGSNSIALAGGSIAAGGNCSVSVNVTSGVTGVHPNTASGVASTQTGAAGNPSNTASLTVIGAPIAAKSFSPASVGTGATSLMTITVTNPNTTTSATGVAFTDTYPTNLVNANPASATLDCTSGSTATLAGGANGGNTLGISAGTLAPSGSCTVTAYVTSATAANYNNSTGTITTTDAGTGTAAAATLNVSNLTVPTVAKSFVTSPIAVNGTATLRITLTNPNTTAVTGVAFNDIYPVGLVNAATPNATTTCSAGTPTATAGGSSLSFSGGTIAASGNCRVDVTVTSADAGGYFNATGTVTTANAGASSGGNATLRVLTPPTITKSFSPDTVATNTNSTLTVTLTNPGVNGVSLTGVSVSDTFPANMASNSTATNTCGGTLVDQSSGTFGSGDTGFQLTGVTLASGASCTVSFTVRSTVAGNRVNTTSAVAATGPIALTGTSASATLSVSQPDITKAFVPATITVGQTSVLTITLTNPTGTNMTGAAFTDSYPPELTNTGSPAGTSNCTAGGATPVVTAANNGSSVSLSGGGIPANSSCTVTVNVTATGAAPNTIPAGALTTSGGLTNGSAANATLSVTPALTASKTFTPSVIPANGASVLTITLSNPNNFNVTGVAFTDTYPTNLVNASTPGGARTCAAGTVSATANGSSLAFSGGTVAANSTCTVTVNVTSATGGVYTNNSGNITTTNAGTTSSVAGTLTVMAQPTVAKAFTPSSISVNGASTLTITLTNPNATQAISGAAFTDTYPAGLVNAATTNAATSCTGGTVIASPGGGSLALTNGTIPAGGSCTVSVSVTSASAASYNNNTGTVTTTNAGNGTAASATLTVQAQPTIAKAFAPASITAGAASTMTITITNPRSTALSGMAFNDLLPSGMRVHATPALSNTCGGAVSGASADSSSIGLTGGTLAASASCAISVAVTANATGTYNNTTSALTTNEAPPSAVSNTAALTVAGFGISGVVYADVNHNSTRDGAETGTGQTLFVKLATRSGASCTSPALVAASVNTTTGAYSMAPHPAGDYCLILDTNSTLTDVTANNPAGWLRTEVPTGIKQITITGSNLIVQNFGLFNGSRLSGRVFNDNGIGSGTANNGVQDGGEAGLANVVVRANNANCASTLCDSTVTSTSGDYTLWIPAAASGSVTITETNPAAFVSTGGNAGTTGGTYARAGDTTTFTFAAATTYTGVNFADVPDASFTTDGAQSALPGANVNYPHTFTAGTAGTVTFTTVSTPTPAVAGWANVIYRDTNCNGVLEAAEASAPFASTSVTAGQAVCIVVREFVPAGIAIGARDQIVVTANFVYSNAAPALSANYTRTDITTVGTPTASGLTLVKVVDKATALPGEVLTYTITYTNASSGALSNIVISDSTPAYTVYVGGSAGCPNLVARTNCTVTAEPAANATGSVRWQITGSLAAGASSTVRYQVQIE